MGSYTQCECFVFKLPGNNECISTSDYMHEMFILLEMKGDAEIRQSNISKFCYAYDERDYRNNL